MELDIYFFSRSLAIEVDGVYNHQGEDVQKRDALKDQLCLEQGIKLLRISDVEINKSWLETTTKILNFIS